jgi:hypothetical protein
MCKLQKTELTIYFEQTLSWGANEMKHNFALKTRTTEDVHLEHQHFPMMMHVKVAAHHTWNLFPL